MDEIVGELELRLSGVDDLPQSHAADEFAICGIELQHFENPIVGIPVD
jgi:hypothetical protein